MSSLLLPTLAFAYTLLGRSRAAAAPSSHHLAKLYTSEHTQLPPKLCSNAADRTHFASVSSKLPALPRKLGSPLPCDVSDFASKLYALQKPPQLVLYLTGGASVLASYLLASPGASQSVLELRIPYAQEALADTLSSEPNSYCSEDTARAMAAKAFERAVQLSSAPSEQCVGLGCTAALRSGQPKRGEHRCFVAVQTVHGVHTSELRLAKGRRERWMEDAVAARLALHTLATACSLTVPRLSEERDFWQIIPQDFPQEVAAPGELAVEPKWIHEERLRTSFTRSR